MKNSTNDPLPDRTERGTIRKTDSTQNEDEPRLEKMIKAQRKRERKLHPLRLNSKTVIYVTKDKNNPQYAESMRIKLGL
ncbi:hypothetical protein [uncultured Bacteroides sp.]|uniref:hypothetical protein n=1 Tax=uncultured Bacteroides sp. TaxID=162156 RepID=UPI002AA8AF62|nr:hypothetical protein [uncultured Bacteroides sp.]